MDGTLTPFTIKDRGLSDAGRRIITLTADGTHYWGSTGGKTVSTQLTSASLKGAAWEVLTYDDLLATLSDATPANPADATFLIQCPGFGRNDTRISAWLGATLTLGGDAKNQCAEAPSGKFDVHQTLTDIPNGVYELTAQGFSKAPWPFSMPTIPHRSFMGLPTRTLRNPPTSMRPVHASPAENT